MAKQYIILIWIVILILIIFIQSKHLMHKVKALLLIALLISLATSLSVISVALNNVGTTSSLQGSVLGGTRLYIQGLGFSLMNSENTILVGDFPCVLQDGATATSMLCITSAPPVIQQYWGLSIVVIVDGQGAVTAPQTFSYAYGQTPSLYVVTPSVGYSGPGSMLYLNGVHRILNVGNDKNLGDIFGIYIGDSICSRFGVAQDAITPNGLAFINCYQPQMQQAGQYLVSEQLYPGISTSYPLTYKADLDNKKNYQFVVLPLVNSTTNKGSITGQKLTITGTGFSMDTSKVAVSVDNVNCAVLTSTLSQITCQLQKKVSQTSLLSSSSLTPNNSYESGTGFYYQRYNITDWAGTLSTATLKQKIDNKTIDMKTLLEKSIRGQIRSQDTFGTNYGQVWKGYFVPTVTGNYKFRGYADDAFALYINSSVYGTTTSFTAPLIYSNSAQSTDVFPNYYYSDVLTAESGNVPLIAGNRYYMEAYHINTYGFGRFSVSVQVPNTDTTVKRWQTYEVHTISTSITHDPEILTFTSTGAKTGNITLKCYEVNPVTNVVSINLNTTIFYNSTAAQFCAALGVFSFYSDFGLTCTLVMYDNDNLITTNLALGAKFIYKVSMSGFRKVEDKAHVIKFTYSNAIGSMAIATVQQHSPLLGGTFTLTLDNTPIKVYNSTSKAYQTAIPFNIPEWALKAELVKLPGLQLMQVKYKGNALNGYKWIIYYIGYNQDLPELVVDDSLLTGGISTSRPTLTSATRRQYSSNLFVDPIDYRFMTTYATKPSVRVTVAGIPSACNADCSYDFITSVPSVTAAAITSVSQLTLTVTNPGTAVLADLTVTLDGQTCVNLTGTFASFACKLPVNADLTPVLRAGSYLPVVFIKNVGFIDCDLSLVSPIVIPLTLTSLSLSTGGNNGGLQIDVTCKGLPSNASEISLTLCNQPVTINSISNTKANIIVPPCQGFTGAKDIIATYKTSLTATKQFTYTTISNTLAITSVSPISWSPTMKGVLNITGTSFGTDASLITVYLSNTTGNIYKMKILSITDTFIQAGIPGGLPGKFDVNVIKSGSGYATVNPVTANDFTYEVVITSVSPLTGSYNGGTLLTITGKNFVPDALETMVTIGDELNQLCKIQSITSTQILCRTPPKNYYYNVSIPQIVLVNSKLIIDSTCGTGATCTFSYNDKTAAPVLTNLSSTAMTGGLLILTGDNFDMGTNVSVSFTSVATGIVINVPVNSTKYNKTQITVTSIPELQCGYYYVRARTDDSIGQSNYILLTINLNVNTPVFSSLSLNGGLVTVTGTGMPAKWPNNYFNQIALSTSAGNLDLNIISTSPTKMVLQLAAAPTTSTVSLTFSITSPLKNAKGTYDKMSTSFSQIGTSTPTVVLKSASSILPGIQSLISLNQTVQTSTIPEILQIYSTTNPDYIVKITTWTASGSLLNFNTTLNTGTYKFSLYDSNLGWYTSKSVLTVSTSAIPYTSAGNVQASFTGGKFTVNGQNIGQGAVIRVNGLVGNLISKTNSNAVFNVPKLITPTTQSSFSLATKSVLNLTSYTTFGDSSNSVFAFDGIHSSIYDSSNSACNVGIDLGENRGVQLTRIRYFPNYKWQVASTYIQGGTFQVSNDKTTWKTLGTIDQTVHAGWNSIMIGDKGVYRYVSFNHTSTSKCNLAEIQLQGIQMSNAQVTDVTQFTTDVTFDDGVIRSSPLVFAGALSYRADKTPKVTSVSQKNGDVFGGYNLTIIGVNLNLGTPTVNIDGIDCVVNAASTATQIICLVGARLKLPTSVFFDVKVGGVPAILMDSFRYVLKWSDQRTWGTDLPPIDDDLIYVPYGMHLLVDVSTPILAGIIVQNGTIQFADTVDMVISTKFITLNGGQFIAGSEEFPYQKKLTFVMYGNIWQPQQPMFGNKGIGCLECKFTMYGQKRNYTWTSLDTKITAGQNKLTVQDPIDWKVGESIVVASTSYDHNEAEERIISLISGKQIIVDRPFLYNHYAGSQNHGADVLDMRAEVGLLTRNIKMMGDDTSIATQYGSHLMLTGSAQNGLVGKIAYTQFTKCGQPQILGRYCHHFHMNGDVPDSYSIGNSVHQSMARVLTIHGVHFLYVAWNVGYRVHGHNFFIEDGIETNNVLQYNLVIGSLTSNNMLQTDISVASFWVTNPTNTLRFNHAAGSDFYGMWYEIKANPDGPSATQDVCPIGNPLGQSHDNVAHSNVRFGLRVFQLYSRQNPCGDIRNNKLDDPWSQNPSIESKFYNYLLYKNGEAGALLQETGHLVIDNFTIAQSKMAGMQFYKANFTKQNVRANNVVIIGRSTGNPISDDSLLNGAKGVILPRTGKIQMNNIRFYAFTSGMTVWEACSKCDQVLLYTNMGAVYYASNIMYTNIAGPYYFMKGLKRQVFYDIDGSLTADAITGVTYTTGAALVHNFEHLVQDPGCKNVSILSQWDDSAVCDNTKIKIRPVAFTNLDDHMTFRSMPIHAQLMDDITKVRDLSLPYTKAYSLHSEMQPKKQIKYSFSLPYGVGRIYNIWWGSAMDWNHVAMVTHDTYDPADDGIIFKFDYIDNRQLYEIGPFRNGKLPKLTQLRQVDLGYLNKATCGNGQYFHNNSDTVRSLQVCASGKDRNLFEYTDIKAVYCRYLCPAPPGSCKKQPIVRQWSNSTQWPNGIMPKNGDNITIPCAWSIIMNIQPATINYLEINGDVYIDDTLDLTISAKNIWIKGGSLNAGSASAPLNHSLTITLNGEKTDVGLTVDPGLTGNKMLVVTGELYLYGKAPATTWSVLTAIAARGATSITVSSSSGWAVGDQITIAPSFSNPSQFEKVTIQSVSGKTVTFLPALKYTHFGASTPTIVKSYGTLDTRAGVGHITRNIKITAGANTTWGFNLVQYGFIEYIDNKNISRTGKVILSGVQFIQGGQSDTNSAAFQMLNVRTQTNHTVITKSSFHECQDMCVFIDNVYDVQFTNNVFYNGRKFLFYALSTFKLTFTNNLMIGVTERTGSQVATDLIACFIKWEAVNPETDMISVTNNLCQGTAGIGYVFSDVDCKYMDTYPYAGNTVGSAKTMGFLLSRGNKASTCLATRGLMAYATQIGQMIGPQNTVQIRFKNFIMADNQRSITLRMGGTSEMKAAYLIDSYVTAVSRPDCLICYGSLATKCSGNHGLRMLTTGQNGQALPDKFTTGFDVVCKAQTIDGKAFLQNVQFDSFRQTYPSNLTECSNNVIFKAHTGASDITGSHHLFNTTCANCQQTAFAYFQKPAVKDLGWFGGCGTIFCTGMNNYMVHDHTGNMLPSKGVLIANNSVIGNNQRSCRQIPAINGHFCTDEDFGVLQYESIAPDFNTRIMWPVSLTADGYNYTTVTNGWREWKWNGGEPLNFRLGRFVSIVHLHRTYNMSFDAAAPADMTLKLQNRLPEANASDWIIVKLFYPFPNSISVQAGAVPVRPISLLDNDGQTPLNTSQCGSNKFFYKNYTVHFVVTGDPACKVRVSLTNSIQLTARFAMNISSFYAMDGVTLFINRMAALLQINDTSRIKVVGVYSGSVIVDTFIDEPAVPITSSTADNSATRAVSIAALNAQVNAAIASGALATGFATDGFGSLESVSATLVPITPSTKDNSSTGTSNTAMIIGIVLGATFIVCLAVVGSVCYMRKRAKIGQLGSDELPMESDSNKQGQINKIVSQGNFSNVDLAHQKKEIF